MEILDKSQRMLETYPLCDNCLGRQFAFLGYGIENHDRGKAIKTILTLRAHYLSIFERRKGVSQLRTLARNGSFQMAIDVLGKMKKKVREQKVCFLCEGHFKLLPKIADDALRKLSEFEYETFLVGVRIPSEIEEKEDEFKARFSVQHGESVRNEVSRLIGKIISQNTGKHVDYINPQIVVTVNPFTLKVILQVNSLFIMGRYRKLVRGITQSRWFCGNCRGKGCGSCNWTGRVYAKSVEELVAKPILEKTGGKDSSFHGAGREDVDALMLGRGRPFIIQIKHPKKRSIDLQEVERAINEEARGQIEVRKMRFVDKRKVADLKRLEASQKTYRAKVTLDRIITDDEITKLEQSLTAVLILQKTPKRSIHSRSDLVREKHIYETKIKRISPKVLEMRIRCEGGLYIKELITGDSSRTEPSVSKIIDAQINSIDLDVLEISAKGV